MLSHLKIIQQMVRNTVHSLLKKQLMATQQVICVRNAVLEGNEKSRVKQKNHHKLPDLHALS